MSCRREQRCFLLYPFTLLFFVIASVLSAKPSDSIAYLKNVFIEEKLRLLSPENVLKSIEIIERDAKNYQNLNCTKDLQIWQRQLRKRELWAVKMQDASSRIPVGLYQGNVIDLGVYDECVGAGGRFCSYGINPSSQKMIFPVVPELSICLPQSCTADDVTLLINKTIEHNNGLKTQGTTINFADCLTMESEEWSRLKQFCLIVLLLYIGFVVLCTLCDFAHRCYKIEWPYRQTLERISILKSKEDIMSVKPLDNDLAVIHGIRVIGSFWIVLVHEYNLLLYMVHQNILDLINWSLSWSALIPFVGLNCVDTFFTLSGFLTAYRFFKDRQQNKKFNIFDYYSHRYIRLTPPIVAYLVCNYIFMNGSGPRYEWLFGMFFAGIKSKFFIFLMYMQNFMQTTNSSAFHLWSLAVDMQFFWISPFILFPIYKKPKIGLLILGSLILASVIITGAIVGFNQYSAILYSLELDVEKFYATMDNIYTMPYARAQSYLLGIFFAYLITSGTKISKKMVYCGWLLSLATFTFCVVGTKSFTEESYVYNLVWEIIFAAISKLVWSFGVCWIIYASTYDCARPIISILSWKYFLPFSKLSYCIYIVHPTFLLWETSVARSPTFFREYYIFHSYLGNLVISIFVAFFFSTVFEMPIRTLEDAIFGKKSKSTASNQNKIK